MKLTINQCEHCHKDFSSKRTTTKFCSGSCKQGAYNKRIRLNYLSAEKEKLIYENSILESLRLKEEQRELEEKTQQQHYLQIQEEFNKKLLEIKDQQRIDRENRQIESANRTLKSWLEKIMSCAEKEEISRTLLLLSLNRIKRDLEDDFYTLPKNFAYFNFICFTLKACLAIWIHEADCSEERYVSFSIPMEVDRIFMDIVQEID